MALYPAYHAPYSPQVSMTSHLRVTQIAETWKHHDSTQCTLKTLSTLKLQCETKIILVELFLGAVQALLFPGTKITISVLHVTAKAHFFALLHFYKAVALGLASQVTPQLFFFTT